MHEFFTRIFRECIDSVKTEFCIIKLDKENNCTLLCIKGKYLVFYFRCRFKNISNSINVLIPETLILWYFNLKKSSHAFYIRGSFLNSRIFNCLNVISCIKRNIYIYRVFKLFPKQCAPHERVTHYRIIGK